LQGGDLFKFRTTKIGFLVAADHAEKSVMDAVTRYNAIVSKPGSYPAQFVVADCHLVPTQRNTCRPRCADVCVLLCFF
jgi:hypothetical protein